MSIDIIGDVHGHCDQLEALLVALGYSNRGGAWHHPNRSAIFVGDFIDRGPQQLKTLNLVRDMVDAGSARAIMANHEFNAIAWATPDPNGSGDFLRSRLGKKGSDNRKHHAAFLDAVVEDSSLHKEWTEWFKTLPLWIDEPSYRVIHACWDQEAVDWMKPKLGDKALLSDELIIAASTKSEKAYQVVETLLKGIEVSLPTGISFTDTMGKERFSSRIKWWNSGHQTYRSAALGSNPELLPDIPIENRTPIATMTKPTFIGHYQLCPAKWPIAPLMPKLACVDFNAGSEGGKMVAYRFDGEQTLLTSSIVAV
jgi:Calcineurin-like phosphoesterase